MPILQQFFFLLILNAVCAKFQLSSHVSTRRFVSIRFIAGIIYALGAGLVMTGYYFAFRESWDLNAAQFFLTWVALWLLMHVHFLIFDTFTALLPMPVMPVLILTWIFVNLASTISPLDVQPGFYHWGTVLPAHNTVLTLFTIWAGGANNKLYRTLPLMFSWWVVGNVTSMLAHSHACMVARRKLKEEGHGHGPREANFVRKEEAEDVETGSHRVASCSTAAPTNDVAEERAEAKEEEQSG